MDDGEAAAAARAGRGQEVRFAARKFVHPRPNPPQPAAVAGLLAQKAAITNWDEFAAANNVTGWDEADADAVCDWTGVGCSAGDVTEL